MMNRDEMERVIKGGRSVFHNGRLITRLEDLPSVAELAKGNPTAEAEASVNLQAQIDALQAQLSQLQQPATPAKPAKGKGKQSEGESGNPPPDEDEEVK